MSVRCHYGDPQMGQVAMVSLWRPTGGPGDYGVTVETKDGTYCHSVSLETKDGPCHHGVSQERIPPTYVWRKLE